MQHLLGLATAALLYATVLRLGGPRWAAVASAAEHERDRDRLQLLDRLAERVPGLDLDQNQVEWTTMDDGAEALVVNGGGFDGGQGAYFTNYGEDVHAVGLLAPLIPGAIGCIVIRPDGSRYLARVMARWLDSTHSRW